MKVLAAMSGGVDSAVAAARAVDAGHDVTGVHLALSSNPTSFRTGARGCCTLEDARDARRAADVIGIPFYVWDLAERFRQDVVDDFVAEYAAGRTPNPCLRCNEKIKFSAVLDKALALGLRRGVHRPLRARRRRARCTAPSTTARTSRTCSACSPPPRSRTPCSRSVEPGRTTYAVRPTSAASRSRPSRTATTSASSPTATPPASCAPGSVPIPGRWSTPTASRSGEHDGAYAFTVGQRRGLRIGRPAPDGKPRYVLDVSPVTRTVTVGPAEELDVSGLVGDRAGLERPATRRTDRVPRAGPRARRDGPGHRVVRR